jgi:hypothetical protein
MDEAKRRLTDAEGLVRDLDAKWQPGVTLQTHIERQGGRQLDLVGGAVAYLQMPDGSAVEVADRRPGETQPRLRAVWTSAEDRRTRRRIMAATAG